MKRWLCVLSVALLAGCGASDPPARAEAPAEAVPPPAAADPVPATNPDTAGAPPPGPAVRVALDGEGLRLVETPSGRTRLLAFGTPAQVAQDALTRAWGAAAEPAELPDCGAEPPTQLAWPNGMRVLLVNGAFTGWSASRPASGAEPLPGAAVQSMAGLGVGVERTEVEGAYALQVRQTTLGTEFEAGGIFGVFEDATPDAEVVSLWAGRACLYR